MTGDHAAAGGIRLIATDLDGTLLDRGSQVSARNTTALRAAAEAGIEVVAATGRGHRSAAPLLAPVGVFRTLVCSNGGVVYDLVDNRVVHVQHLPSWVAAASVAAVRAAVPRAGLGWELADGSFGWDDAFLALRPALSTTRAHERRSAPPLDDDDAVFVKLLVIDQEHSEGALLDLVAPGLPPEATGTYSGVDFVEITGPGVTKASGLELVCGRLGIGAGEVLAFGDNPNDVAMLRWAGRSVAMGNAHPWAIAAATEVGPHHDPDGVAQVVEALLDASGPAPGG